VSALLVKVTRYAFLFWLPLYLTERLGYRPDQAGYLSSVYELAGIGGALLAGYCSDRLFGSRRYPVVCLMLAGLAGACLLPPVLGRFGWTGTLIAIAAVGVTTFGPDSMLQGAAAQDIGGGEDAGSAAGLVNGVASVGQLLSPYLVAGVSSMWGWDALFGVFVGIALAASVISGLFWNHRALRPPA
jgi:sugar phosphate permease